MDIESNKEIDTEIDTYAYGWVITALAFLVDALVAARSLILVVIILWEDDFGWSRYELSMLMVIVHVCNGLCTPISGHLVDL